MDSIPGFIKSETLEEFHNIRNRMQKEPGTLTHRNDRLGTRSALVSYTVVYIYIFI